MDDDEALLLPSAGAPAAKRRRNSRSQRGKLRKHHDLDHVKVEEPFVLVLSQPTNTEGANNNNDPGGAGDGCYVTAAVNSRRYYGVLIDQAALKAASLLHFQDEAGGLDLNRRMRALSGQHQGASEIINSNGNSERKRPASSPSEKEDDRKRLRGPVPLESPSSGSVRVQSTRQVLPPRQVQKFRYNEDGSRGYRVLLATFADVAAAGEDDSEKEKLIEAACQAGGNYVGAYYYQYEATGTTLQVLGNGKKNDPSELKMSLGFQEFLAKTMLPAWYPLSNLQFGQQQVLNLLNMKKDNKGNVLWDEKAEERKTIVDLTGSIIPMEPRSFYRVCVVGGGIAGLSACLEIFRKCERESIEVEVVLVEGRSRLGGRLWTDRETFKTNNGRTNFPVDLGASWIHGIDLNPLAALARDAGVEFARTGEDVKMFEAGMKEVDHEKDTHAGEFFDKLLDIAADRSWGLEGDRAQKQTQTQAAVRWYGSVLGHSQGKDREPVATDVADHRRSSDISVDRAIGNAMAKQQLAVFEKLSEEERRMLFWNMKNVEYALGANLSDLSMKFWDIDERHAFEGDHVLLRQGYSVVVGHLLQQLLRRGNSFKYHLSFHAGKLEYARKSTSQTYSGNCRRLQLSDLSDSCCVTSADGSKCINCDFVVCAVPLGILKDALVDRDVKDTTPRLEFSPSLPFLKRDAIESVGFGLLDKVYLQFPWEFWRTGDCRLREDQTLFGNASGKNPHHYMFFDIGKILGRPLDAPAILMSLISGKEAVKCEQLTENELVQETLETLRTLFSGVHVPDPIAVKATRWGDDKFSRGSYTFLPPGATDQDFQSLQSPINGNGDSLLLEGSETMRLFFAGEHTTALHPSMAHGAMLSGIRAGAEVFAALSLHFQIDDSIDRLIPMSVFRYMNPHSPLDCAFCHLTGGRAYEGPLLAFKRGSRQVLVHNCCAENSPEVEVNDGQWKNVLKAVNRSVALECRSCGQNGASIGCNHATCNKCYHFSCAEKSGWSFSNNGKEFFCSTHRPFTVAGTGSSAGPEQSHMEEKDNIQHALFSSLSADEESKEAAGGLGTIGEGTFPAGQDSQDAYNETVDEKTDLTSIGRLTSDLGSLGIDVLDTRLARFTRQSLQHCWNAEFLAEPLPPADDGISSDANTISTMRSVLVVANVLADDPCEPLESGDIVLAINGERVGSPELDTVEKFIARLGQEVDVLMEIQSGNSYNDANSSDGHDASD